MSAPEAADPLTRENIYLRQRVAQLQEDVTAITAEADRLRQIVERIYARKPQAPPNPLGSGQ